MPESFQVFSDFVGSFRLTPPEDAAEYEHIQTSKVSWHSIADDRMVYAPEIWFQPHDQLSLAALQKKLSSWLARQGLPSDEESVGLTIVVLALLAEEKTDLVESLKELQRCIKTVDVIHFHVLPSLGGSGWEGTFNWSHFRFERLDASKLGYRCRKADANLLLQKASALDGSPSIRSPIFNRPTLDISDLFWRKQSPLMKAHGIAILQCMFQHTAALFADAMWDALEDALLLPYAISFHLFDLERIRYFPEAQTWTCMTGLGISEKHSWVGCSEFQPRLRIPKLDQAQRLFDKAESRFHFEKLPLSSLSPLITTVSRTLVRGTNHLSSQRIDESFLFQVIAIEQVFSETENTSKVVSSRTSLIAQFHLKQDWQKTFKHVSTVYDKRSRLVHSGKSVTQEDLLDAADLSSTVLRCLLRLALRPESHKEDFHKLWLKRLDYLIAGIEAGKPPSEADLIENGIIDSPTP